MTKSAQWPACLDWYTPATYDIGTLHPLYWFSLLWQRDRIMRCFSQAPDKARELLAGIHADPLRIVYLDFAATDRPVHDVGFADVARVVALLDRPTVAPKCDEWSPAAQVREVMARRRAGAPRPAELPSLHDHLLDEWAHVPDTNDVQLRRGLRLVLVQVDLGLPHAERMIRLDQVVREREQRLKDAGIRFGTAPTRGESVTGYISRERVETWAKLRVLDYLDIKITCLVHGVAMPSAADLGEKLFATLVPLKGKQRAVDLGERVRKYTAPEAERIMRPEFLEVYAMQMAAAQADQEAKEK